MQVGIDAVLNEEDSLIHTFTFKQFNSKNGIASLDGSVTNLCNDKCQNHSLNEALKVIS